MHGIVICGKESGGLNTRKRCSREGRIWQFGKEVERFQSFRHTQRGFLYLYSLKSIESTYSGVPGWPNRLNHNLQLLDIGHFFYKTQQEELLNRELRNKQENLKNFELECEICVQFITGLFKRRIVPFNKIEYTSVDQR